MKARPQLRNLREVLQQQEEQEPYLLFARPHVNHPRVSEDVGATIAFQRGAVGLTQAAVARRACMTTQHLADIEKGRHQPSISEFLSLSEATGIDPRELFNRALDKMHYPVGCVPVKPSATLKRTATID